MYLYVRTALTFPCMLFGRVCKKTLFFVICCFSKKNLSGIPSDSEYQSIWIQIRLNIFWNFACFFCCLLILFKINFFKKFKSTIRECQTVWFQIKSRHFVSPDLGPDCLKMLNLYWIETQTGKELKCVF